MSEQTLNLVETLRQRVRAAGRRITLSELLFGAAITLGLAAGLWLVAFGLEAIFWLDPALRTAIFWLLVVATAGVAAVFVVAPALRLLGLLPGLSDYSIAERIGARFPNVADRLTNLLQLVDGRSTRAPAPLVEGAVLRLGEQLQGVSFDQVEDFERPRRAGQLALAPVAGLLVLLLAAPSLFLSTSERLLAYDTPFERPAPFSLEVEPSFAELVRGDPLEITVRASGEAPPAITLALNHLDEEVVDEIELEFDEDGVARHRIDRVRESLRFRASAGRVESRWHEAHVVERPILRNLQVDLTYPAYSGLSPESLEPNRGNVHALPGTEVDVEAQFGGSDVETALLAFDDGTVDTMEVADGAATGRFTLEEDGAYEVMLVSPEGVENQDPVEYTLRAQTDAPPTIEMLAPEREATLGTDLEVPTEARIRDDFGFSQLRLYYRLAETRYGQPMEEETYIDLPLPSQSDLDQNIDYEWLLRESTDLDPVPGDVIEYYLRVWDNDTVSGPKAARTSAHRLRLPSLTERYEEFGEAKDDTEDSIERSLESAESIREQFESLRDELRGKPEADWEDERELERIMEQHDALEEEVEELTQRVESISESLQDDDLASEETAQMWQELEEVVREIQSPELQEALEKLQEAMQETDLQNMQQSLDEIDFSEEQYNERLERALELFNNLRVQQELEEAGRRLEDLAQQQEEVTEETGRRHEEGASDEEANEDLARAQEQSAEDMQRLEDHIEEVQERMEELRQAPRGAMEELREALEEQQMPQQLEENAEQLRQDELEDAQQGQQEMQEQMSSMQQQLTDMQQQMQGNQMEINLAGLRQALSDVLSLSHRQEASRDAVQSASEDSPRLREEAQHQTQLTEGMQTVSDSLQQIGRDVPQMGRAIQEYSGRALREMRQATESLSERAIREATTHQRGSMMHLNELALLLSELHDQLQNGEGAGEGMSMDQMMQQLEEMAGNQEELNQEIQEMINETQGERLSVEQEERVEQMAAQQEAIRQQLRDLNREREVRNRTLGDLERVAEEMQRSIDELQGQSINRELENRQEQILTRLLEATQSMHSQDESDERQGRTAEQILRESPEDLTPEEQTDVLRRALLRSLESGYAPDYEDLIRRYFELLQEHNDER